MTKILMILFVAVGTCSADVVDFTLADPFSAGDGQSSATFTHLGNTFTLVARPNGARLTWNPGFGITYSGQLLDEPDEIDYPEVLWVQFANPTSINSFTVSNMYLNEGLFGWNDERGRYSIDEGQTWVSFWGSQTGDNVITVGGSPVVSSIRFTVNKSDVLFDEYTLKAMNINRVPEGSAAVFLGIVACGALITLRRRTGRAA